jgi:hypothetical protein
VAGVGKRLSPACQKATLNGKQKKFIGQLFTRRIEVDQFASLYGLADSIAIARPQLDGLHSTPPLDAKDTMLRRLSTFPQRSKVLVEGVH